MKERVSAQPGGTDWERLGAMSEQDIKGAIEADPQARPTDVEFWKDAKVVIPQARKS